MAHFFTGLYYFTGFQVLIIIVTGAVVGQALVSVYDLATAIRHQSKIKQRIYVLLPWLIAGIVLLLSPIYSSNLASLWMLIFTVLEIVIVLSVRRLLPAKTGSEASHHTHRAVIHKQQRIQHDAADDNYTDDNFDDTAESQSQTTESTTDSETESDTDTADTAASANQQSQTSSAAAAANTASSANTTNASGAAASSVNDDEDPMDKLFDYNDNTDAELAEEARERQEKDAADQKKIAARLSEMEKDHHEAD